MSVTDTRLLFSMTLLIYWVSGRSVSVQFASVVTESGVSVSRLIYVTYTVERKRVSALRPAERCRARLVGRLEADIRDDFAPDTAPLTVAPFVLFASVATDRPRLEDELPRWAAGRRPAHCETVPTVGHRDHLGSPSTNSPSSLRTFRRCSDHESIRPVLDDRALLAWIPARASLTPRFGGG